MNENFEPLYQFLLEKLNIRNPKKIEKEYKILIGNRELIIDLAIETTETVTLIEFKSRINEETIYRIYTLSHLIDKNLLGTRNIRLVCVGKSLKYSTQELSERLNVEVIILPPKIYHYFSSSNSFAKLNTSADQIKISPLRVTSQKSWKIICSLMESEFSSIRAISQSSGVSYGWTHSITKRLAEAGIVNIGAYGVRLQDVDRLLNVVSWERPLESLLVKDITTNFSNAKDCMQEVALNLSKVGIDYAFTVHSSAVYYGTSVIRDDTVYLYLPISSDRDIIESFAADKKMGCRLKIYVPDRDVIGSSKLIGGIRMVDIYQTIMDLAGIGVGGYASAKELVKKIGKQ
ncbi:MAG: hypothetical protein ACYDAO_04860 [Thermoplasmataceae archaeon]